MSKPRAILVVLLSAALASTCVVAGTGHARSSSDDFSWSVDGQSLRLHSSDGTGVVVEGTEPTPFHGLQTGDVILSIDNHRVARVGDLLQALRYQGHSPAALRVRRAGAEITVSWTHAECQALNPLASPPTPPPPHS